MNRIIIGTIAMTVSAMASDKENHGYTHAARSPFSAIQPLAEAFLEKTVTLKSTPNESKLEKIFNELTEYKYQGSGFITLEQIRGYISKEVTHLNVSDNTDIDLITNLLPIFPTIRTITLSGENLHSGNIGALIACILDYSFLTCVNLEKTPITVIRAFNLELNGENRQIRVNY